LEYSDLELNGILTHHGCASAKVNAAVGGTSVISGIPDPETAQKGLVMLGESGASSIPRGQPVSLASRVTDRLVGDDVREMK
jgi:hypothetical protein